MKQASKPTTPAPKKPSTPSTQRSLVLLVLLLGVVVVLGLSAAGGTAFALSRENHDTFCASCHTEPESRYVQQSLAQKPETLASLHTHKQVRCIDCHSDAGKLGRVAGLKQGATDLIAYYSGNYHHPAITTAPLGDESCTKCHADISAQATMPNHFHYFLPKWQAMDPNAAHCIDCHKAHPTGNSAQSYLTEATVLPVCQQCHAAAGEGG